MQCLNSKKVKSIKIEWLGHASFKLAGKKVIYIDPFQIPEGEPADIILITHPHHDHCSVDDVKKIVKLDTVIIAPIDCQSKIAEGKFHYAEFKNVVPGDKISIYGYHISAVPAYNVNKHFHNKSDEWVGYVVSDGNKSIYHAGDTDFIQEMASIKTDVAMLPVGGTYTMNAREAAQATFAMKPKVAIPMHYGSIVGKPEDAEVFAKSVAHSKVQIMKKGQIIDIV